MRTCIVGSGAREHALADALSAASEVVCSPGNPGIARIAECTTAPPQDLDADLFVIGPEAPLVDGLADVLRGQGKVVLGPGKDGARLEGSKKWMKEVLTNAEVPTARFRAFTAERAAIDYLKSLPPPWVIKTDGLAAGKGVLVTDDLTEAVDDVERKLRGLTHQGAGTTVVIEEGMVGPELSVLALCDGQRAVPLPAAQDFKRVGDGDTGPNTGGMGAYSPVPFATHLVDEVMDRCIEPTLDALKRQQIDYRGVLYCGLMITQTGVKVVEFNVRFGDPETQVVLPRIGDDLSAWLLAAAVGALPEIEIPKATPDACVTVMMATKGYPEAPTKGDVITGIDAAEKIEGVRVYHAGTATNADDELITAGGRVLSVTASRPTIQEARATAYQAVACIDFEGAHWRTDIAKELR